MNKFSAVPVSRRKTHELVIVRRRIEHQDKVRILGFKSQHASNQTKKDLKLRKSRQEYIYINS